MSSYAGGCGEEKDPKEATVASSGFESKYDSVVAINNFVRVAYFHGCFAKGTCAWNFLDFTKINYDRVRLSGDPVFCSGFCGHEIVNSAELPQA